MSGEEQDGEGGATQGEGVLHAWNGTRPQCREETRGCHTGPEVYRQLWPEDVKLGADSHPLVDAVHVPAEVEACHTFSHEPMSYRVSQEGSQRACRGLVWVCEAQHRR